MRKRLCLTFALLLDGCNALPQGTPVQQQVRRASDVPVGRFIIVHSPEIERDTTLLDTATGRTWQLVVDKQQNESWEAFGQDNGMPIPTDIPNGEEAKYTKVSDQVAPVKVKGNPFEDTNSNAGAARATNHDKL